MQLGLDRGTVRRFARAASVDELLVKATNRVSVLDGHTEHLLARFTVGITDTTTLLAELRHPGAGIGAPELLVELVPLAVVPHNRFRRPAS